MRSAPLIVARNRPVLIPGLHSAAYHPRTEGPTAMSIERAIVFAILVILLLVVIAYAL